MCYIRIILEIALQFLFFPLCCYSLKSKVLNYLNSFGRFLISFSGRYLAYDIRVSSLDCEKGDASSANHQLLKIYVPQIDMALSGPAFIEVSLLTKL